MKKLVFVFSFFFSITFAYPYLPAETKLVKSARRSMDYMSYEQAVGYLEQAILEDPSQKDARIYLAFSYFRLGKEVESIQALKEELILFPDSFNAFSLLGYIYFNQGDYDKATNTCLGYENVAKVQAKKDGMNLFPGNRFFISPRKRRNYISRVRAKYPNYSLPYFILGLSYKRSGSFRKAVDNFQYALEWGYDPVACYTQLIDVELSKKDWRGAVSKSQEALEIEGPQAEFYFLMGFSYHHLGETENAVECFKKSIELKPYQTESIENLAKIYIRQGKFKNAGSLLRRALKMGTFNQETYSLQSDSASAESKKIEEARTKLDKDFVDALELHYQYDFIVDVNDVVFGIHNAALDLLKAGRIDAAGNLMRTFLEINDLSPGLNYNLAKLYELNKSFGKALKYAWRAKELKAEFKDAYDLIASIFFDLGNFEKSAEFYNKVIELNPNDAMSFYNLGCVFSAMKDDGKAETHWRAAIQNEQKTKPAEKKDESSKEELSIDITVKVWPISFEAHKSLGHLYLQQHSHEKALEEFIKAIELEPQDPGPYFEVGKIYFELKDRENATFYFDKYIYLGGNEEKVTIIIKSSGKGGFCLLPKAREPRVWNKLLSKLLYVQRGEFYTPEGLCS
jgi:protein O-GlcNAc transferase